MEGTTRLDPNAAPKQECGLQERDWFAHVELSFVDHKVFHELRHLLVHSRSAS
jgi:hypothetical protein